MSDPSLEAQQEFYDKRWWKGVTSANLPQLEKAIAVLEGLHLIGERNPRILDLGCGNGWLSGILGSFGPTTGVDLSPVAIEYARSWRPDVAFVNGDFFQVNPEGQPFDVVVSVEVIQHVEDQVRFLELIASWMKPGGHLILLTPSAWNLRHWTNDEMARLCLQPVEHRLTAAQLRKLLAPLFQVRQLKTILFGQGHGGLLRLVHSVKLWKLLSAAGLQSVYKNLVLRMGCGLLFCVVAQRR